MRSGRPRSLRAGAGSRISEKCRAGRSTWTVRHFLCAGRDRQSGGEDSPCRAWRPRRLINPFLQFSLVHEAAERGPFGSGKETVPVFLRERGKSNARVARPSRLGNGGGRLNGFLPGGKSLSGGPYRPLVRIRCLYGHPGLLRVNICPLDLVDPARHGENPSLF